MFTRMSQLKKHGMKLALAVAVTGVCMEGAVAVGQVRPVIGGNALDANPQVGGGGSNTPVPGMVPINGNDIVTGNVGGLKYFHGNVPYSNQFEFRGGLSAVDRFNRQSYTGVPLGQTYQGVATPYYTPTRAVSAEQGTYFSSPINGGAVNQFLPKTSVSPLNANNTIGSNVTLSVPINAAAGARRYDDLTINPLDVTPLQPSGLFGFKNALQNTPVEKPIDRLEKERLEQEKEKDRHDLGASARIGSAVQPIASAVKPIDNSIQPLGAEADSEVYKTLQEQIVAKRATAAKTPVPAANPGATPGLASAQSLLGGRAGAAPGGPSGEFAIPYQSDDPSKPFYRAAGPEKKAPAEQPTETLTSGKEIKPIATFKGDRNTIFNQYMTIAEKQLMEGRYLDAAGTYQAAGQMAPDNPLTLIGRAHAELAAGLYSAGVEDLQVVFEKRPELMAVHYDLKAFIPEKRLNHLLDDVAKLAREGKANPTANFALAYMDYQLGRKDDLKITLDIWKRQSPKDTWQPVCERAWGESK